MNKNKVPVDYLAHNDTDKNLKKYLGLYSESKLLDFLDCGFFYLPGRDISQNEGAVPFYKKKLDFTETERSCPLRIRWKREVGAGKFSVDSAIRGPLERPDLTVEDILRFPWPEASDFDFSSLLSEAETNNNRIRIGGLWSGIMGDSYRMHGFQNFLLNSALNPEVIHTLVGRMTEMYLKLNDKYFSTLKGNLEIWFFGNDFGSQESMLMSLEMWHELFFDNIKQLCALAHSYGLQVMMHSCGAIEPLIPFLIEAGVDILDPVQITATGMDPATLTTKYGGQITFHGGIDTQNILPFGSAEDVEAHVRNIVGTMAPAGRYIFAPSQILGSDIPIENIITMYKTIREINAYVE